MGYPFVAPRFTPLFAARLNRTDRLGVTGCLAFIALPICGGAVRRISERLGVPTVPGRDVAEGT